MNNSYVNIPMEKAVLGYLIFASLKQRDLVPNLRSDIFFDQSNEAIFKRIQSCVQSGSVADLLYLQKFDEIDVSYLMELQDQSVALNPKWIEELNELSIKRKLTECYLNALQTLDSGVRECVDGVSLVHDEVLGFGQSAAKSKAEIIKELDDKIIRAKENKGIQGLQVTGIRELDECLNGAEGGDLIVIGARPSVGKSLLASNIVSESMKRNIRSVVWTLEMSASNYLERVIANVSNVEYGSMRSGRIELDDAGYVEGKDYFHESSVEIIDKHGVDVDEIRSEILSLNSKQKVECLVIDYGGLIRPSKSVQGKSTNDQSGYTSGRLKQLAIELNIPVIMLWQLNREVERRNPSIPKLADLRNSGEVEQDADKAVFIYRPIVHSQTPSWLDMGIDGKLEDPPENITLFKVAKNRNGELGKIPALFIADNMKFVGYESTTVFNQPTDDNVAAGNIMKADKSNSETFDLF